MKQGSDRPNSAKEVAEKMANLKSASEGDAGFQLAKSALNHEEIRSWRNSVTIGDGLTVQQAEREWH